MILWLERNLINMISKIVSKLMDKKLAILGCGKEGKGTIRWRAFASGNGTYDARTTQSAGT